MKSITAYELPDEHKEVYYKALVNTQPPEVFRMIRIMIAGEGVEVAFSRFMDASIGNGVEYTQEFIDAIYNAFLYIAKMGELN